MVQLNDFPDLGRSAALLKISVDLEDLTDDSIISIAVQKELHNNNLKAAMGIIKKYADDNRTLIINLIGEDLLKRIERFS